jgi:hypothetical protein
VGRGGTGRARDLRMTAGCESPGIIWLVPALPSSILEPLWVQIAALLPTRQVHHPLGCHRPASPTASSLTSSSGLGVRLRLPTHRRRHLLAGQPGSYGARAGPRPWWNPGRPTVSAAEHGGWLTRTGWRSRGIGGRLHGIFGSPGVHAARQRLGLEAQLAKLQRRTGTGLLPRSGAVQHERLIAEAVGRPLGDLVGQDPDAAGNPEAVAFVF